MGLRRSIHCILAAALFTSLCATTSCSNKSKARIGVDAGVTPRVDAGGVSGAAGVLLPSDVLAIEQSAPGDWEKVRDQALENLVKLASQGDPRRLGFDTPPALNSLKALDPIPNALVRYVDVSNYSPLQNPADLIKTDERLTFPIVNGNTVMSAVTLTKVSGAWKVVSYGEPRTIRAVMTARVLAVHPKVGPPVVKPGKAAGYKIVTVTGLNESFLAAEGLTGALYFIPLFERPRLGFSAGLPLVAKDVLQKLRPLTFGDAGVLPTPTPAP